jgi:hypothetical protein
MSPTVQLIIALATIVISVAGVFLGLLKLLRDLRRELEQKLDKMSLGRAEEAIPVLERIALPSVGVTTEEVAISLLQVVTLGLMQETPVWRRMFEHSREKERLGEYIVQHYLPDNCTMLLDSGTTAAQVARKIAELRHSVEKVYTNNLLAALYLLPYKQTECVLVGGVIDENYAALLGDMAKEAVDDIETDVTILAATSIEFDAGPRGRSSTNQAFKQVLVRNAHKLIVVVDASKLGRVIGDPVLLDAREWKEILDRDTVVVTCGEPDESTRDVFEWQVKQFGDKLKVIPPA